MPRNLIKMARIPALAAACIGMGLGVGSVTVDYAQGLSYLSTDPAACANCHIMRPQYDAWQKSSHHAVAGCADCHLPAEGAEKYLAKVENGFHHSRAFTQQNFAEPIVITEGNAGILHDNCLRCHAELVHMQAELAGDAPRCMRCHASVGHGEPVGLGGPSTTPQHPENATP